MTEVHESWMDRALEAERELKKIKDLSEFIAETCELDLSEDVRRVLAVAACDCEAFSTRMKEAEAKVVHMILVLRSYGRGFNDGGLAARNAVEYIDDHARCILDIVAVSMALMSDGSADRKKLFEKLRDVLYRYVLLNEESETTDDADMQN
jgi:hypothetical protein